MTLYYKESNLYIECDILTPTTAAEVVNALLEFLLYKRNQIPLVYTTYRYYVDNWSENDKDINSFQLQRQKANAKLTRVSIGSMKKLIRDIFDKEIVTRLRFLFGSTVFTAKEAYTLHISPKFLSHKHKPENHPLPAEKLKQTLLDLVSDQTFYALFSSTLITTNIYLEFEIKNNATTSKTSASSNIDKRIFYKDTSKLPRICKDIHFHILPTCNNRKGDEILQCCKYVQVCEDMEELNIKEQINKNSNDEKRTTRESSRNAFAWYEAEIFIRGYKEQPIKGINMWC